jgi:hypothetical protein
LVVVDEPLFGSGLAVCARAATDATRAPAAKNVTILFFRVIDVPPCCCEAKDRRRVAGLP